MKNAVCVVGRGGRAWEALITRADTDDVFRVHLRDHNKSRDVNIGDTSTICRAQTAHNQPYR